MLYEVYVVALPEGQVTALVLRGADVLEGPIVLRTVVLAVLLGYSTAVPAAELLMPLVPTEPVLNAVPDADAKVEFAVD